MTQDDTPRVTIEALRYYVPLFQEGDRALERLMDEGEQLDDRELHRLESLVRLRELAAKRVADLARPLIIHELQKIMASSHLRENAGELFDLLYYAGVNGMKKGLRKFDVDKINVSSTNYLFQWITTYAKKELLTLEAPFGIPPSRFQQYKKISAVRKRLTELQGSYATNDEVYEFLQTGRADMRKMNGRVKNAGKPSAANKAITLDLIAEQERFERSMLSVALLDPQEGYSKDLHLREDRRTPFVESFFGIFLQAYPFTTEARLVLMSNLSVAEMTLEEQEQIQALDASTARRLTRRWSDLMKDVEGPFYEFLQKQRAESFQEFDVRSTIASIEALAAKDDFKPARTYCTELFQEGSPWQPSSIKVDSQDRTKAESQ